MAMGMPLFSINSTIRSKIMPDKERYHSPAWQTGIISAPVGM
jgi:hypothetical protein